MQQTRRRFGQLAIAFALASLPRFARAQSYPSRPVRAHAGEPDLDPTRVAERLGMSVRYLRRLLEPTGRAFSEHLLGKRLERAAALLRDPRFTHVKISAVAQKAGFSDISHFNRSFRHAFGDTPFGLRTRAARKVANSE
jgi:AraC-like DNA-binding protein